MLIAVAEKRVGSFHYINYYSDGSCYGVIGLDAAASEGRWFFNRHFSGAKGVFQLSEVLCLLK